MKKWETSSDDTYKTIGLLLCGLDGGRCGHDHEDAVGQDGCDDEQREQRVNQDANGHTTYGVEGV